MNAYVVDKASLEHNIRHLSQQMEQAKVRAVVKGDGYGLGLLALARVCHEQGIAAFAVTMPEDASALAEAGLADDLLMLRVTDNKDELDELLRAGAILSVGSERSLQAAHAAARRAGHAVKAHLYFDCGMCREGFDLKHPEAVLPYLTDEEVQITGVYTHFPRAGGPREDTINRFVPFQKAVEVLKASGWAGEVHCANSLTAMRYPEMRLDAVRIGSAFLGRISYDGAGDTGLKPVGYLECDITDIREIQPGDTVGYGCAWTAKRPSRIAVLDIGTFEGYNTEISREYFNTKDYIRSALSPIRKLLKKEARLATVNGKKVAVVGRVAMQHTMLDVTDISCEVHDKAILPCNPLLVRHVPVEFR